MNAVETTNVFCVYGAHGAASAALQGLSLEIPQGELTAVIGPSGSGKSTLLRLLAGLEKPSVGVVRVFGRDLAALSRSERGLYRLRELGYVDQRYWKSLDPHATVRDVVARQLAIDGRPAKERRARASALLERVGLAGREEAFPAALSGGEQQRVALCAAVAHRPALILADEPTGELDPRSSRAVYDVLAELVREHAATAVLVTHDESVSRIADRLLHIRDGRVSGERSDDGAEHVVVNRGGWVQIPAQVLAGAGVTTRGRVHAETGRVVLTPAGATAAPVPEQPARDAHRRAAGTRVEARGLAKEVGTGGRPRTLFPGLGHTFEPGSLTAVTGPSGSGKTTLLSLLAGMVEPSAGDVLVGGVRLGALTRAERAELRRTTIAFAPQQAGLSDLLDALENVELALATRGFASAHATAEAERALVLLGLAERLHHRVGLLSGGERQRVALARAIAAGTPVLLADEPTARLDEASARAVTEALAAIARDERVTVICATHDPIVAAAADCTVELDADEPAPRPRVSPGG
jgi:ABC-type lipoprotein export system ATPase subunit